MTDRRRLPLRDQMERLTERGDGCWEWLGNKTLDGYGRLQVGGSRRRAHRIAYELARGPIPPGLVLDHLCRNRSCVNPEHLEPVTDRENILRGNGLAACAAARDTCARGHPLTDDNTYRPPSNPNERKCRICKTTIWKK